MRNRRVLPALAVLVVLPAVVIAVTNLGTAPGGILDHVSFTPTK